MTFPNESLPVYPMENQIMCGLFDDKSKINNYVDLRPFLDDKTVLKNPHKGWFWHFIDNGARIGAYRDRTVPGDYMEDFPGLNHLYLRFDWSDIEKEKDVYDFSLLDEIMDEWGKHGYTFSMRMCSYENAPFMEFAAPKYLFEEGIKCYNLEQFDCAVQPDYGDAYFLERLELFLKKLGEKYNNDPRVELIDIGSYGTWGEGHTVCGDGAIYPLDVVLKHIDLHIKYFDNKFLIINDDHIMGRMSRGSEEAYKIYDYAYERGLGVQDDSICCDGYSVENAYDTMRAPWAFQKLSENAPSVIEFAHYTYIRPQFDNYFRNGYTIIECLKNSKATFAGFHGYPRVWLENEKYLTEYCANRLGYWYHSDYAIVPELVKCGHNIIKIAIRNKGWSKAYHRHIIRILISNSDFSKEINTGVNIDFLDADEEKEFSFNLNLCDIPEGEYDISFGVFLDDKPIKLALKEEIMNSGYYKICRRNVKGL